MAELAWDQAGDKTYETGVDRGVLYYKTTDPYDTGVAWNGLVSVTESPSGAEANPQYADNIKYINLISAEEFAATLEAFTYPAEFEPFDGLGVPMAGMSIGQQSRGTFGLSYRTRYGNDEDGDAYGYKIHLIYGCQATPSEKAYQSVNDSPEAITFSWEISTTPIDVGTINSVEYAPTSIVTLDSVALASDNLTAVEDLVWGSSGGNAELPTPLEVYTALNTP